MHENGVSADGAVKVKKIPIVLFCVWAGVQKKMTVRGGTGFDKNVPFRHIMWAALANCVAIVSCQLTSVISGHPVSKLLE